MTTWKSSYPARTTVSSAQRALANGIVTGMTADMLLPSGASCVLGGLSGGVEIASVVLLFLLVLHRTARQSIEPHNP
jgi:hypothetical protein